MAFYDYKCLKCDHIQEEFHSITLEPEIKCEKCNSLCKRTIPNNMNFILKGDGWAGKEIKQANQRGKKNEIIE